MARKKRQTYGDMVRMMGTIQEKMSGEKDCIAGVLASELDYDTALQLGDLSDTELRRVARFMFDRIGMFINLAKLDMPKARQAAEDGPMVEGELQYNYSENRWEVWDTDTGKQVGTLRDGMCVELSDGINNENWKPVKIRVMVMDCWYTMSMDKSDSESFRGLVGLFGGLRVRLRGMDN